MATVRLASDGEIPLAMSRPVVFGGKSRRAPSGKVTATIAKAPIAHSLPTDAGKRGERDIAGEINRATGQTRSLISETRHNFTERSGGFKLWQSIAATVAQESSRQDHTAAPLPDDRGTHVRARTRIAIKRVQISSAAG